MTDNLPTRARSPARDEDYRSKRQKTSLPSQLCAQCRLLKLDRSFIRAAVYYGKARNGKIPRSQELRQDRPNGPLYYEDAFEVHHFQSRLSKPSDCPLCSFFRSMRAQPDKHREYKLLAFCSSESSLFCRPRLQHTRAWEEAEPTVFMAVVPDIPSIPSHGHEEYWLEKDVPAVGSIYRLRPGEIKEGNALLDARELSDKVDFGVVREWLDFCNQHHAETCKRRMIYGTISHSFRVIDCNKSHLAAEKQPWGTPYVALSYVWGSREDDKIDWPNTVRDAVAVTREMGLQYLWVDRLCIDQKNEKEKAYLIGKMTLIYSEADFTIVAAAGSGASYGIPGVGARPRKAQTKVDLESGSTLISTLRDPRLEILDTEWSTRGWTYQEGILSNRRLVFTDHQAYWECKCMAIHDSISLPLKLTHESDRTRMADFMLGGIFKSISYSAGTDHDDGEVLIADDSYRLDYGFPIDSPEFIRGVLRGLEEHIRAFSARTLSYDMDSLKAFQGILNLYSHDSMLQTVLGIPIWTNRIAGYRPGICFTFALSICSWYHRSASNLRMFASEPSRRRLHLPSWTWAGWKGTVSWRAPPQEEHSVIMCNLIEVDDLDFLWAAFIRLRNRNGSDSRYLEDVSSFQCLTEDLNVLVVGTPLILKYFTCKPTTKEWSWRRHAGREGREKYDAGRMDWDDDWRRLAGRLVCISISLRMTWAEWTQKHFDKELISVLMFVGRDPGIKHGRARFLTLRKVQEENGEERWERVGTVQLTVSASELAKYKTVEEMLAQLPIRRRDEEVVIY